MTATVAMDYALATNQLALGRFIKFYVFNPGGQRVIKADLDQHGDKYVPWLCTICHGVNFYTSSTTGGTNLGTTFLPFDLNAYTYSQSAAAAPGAQDTEFKKMNQAITNSAYESFTEQDLLVNWYLNGTFNKNYVFPVWSAASDTPVYRDVLRVSCRTCHTALQRHDPYGVDDGFDLYSPTNLKLIYGSQWVGQYLWMPRAQRNWTTFWGSKTANSIAPNSTPNQPEILRARYIGSNPSWGTLP